MEHRIGREDRARTESRPMTRSGISSISPFFIVTDVAAALAFYRDRLDFEVIFREPAEDPFFAIVCRDGAMIMVKSVGVEPLPNCERQSQARWDAYLLVPDPDALAAGARELSPNPSGRADGYRASARSRRSPRSRSVALQTV